MFICFKRVDARIRRVVICYASDVIENEENDGRTSEVSNAALCIKPRRRHRHTCNVFQFPAQKMSQRY